MKKIDRMHEIFGKAPDICRNCSNLDPPRMAAASGRRYYKCRVYGVSASEATDWRLSWAACGMLNKKYSGEPVYKIPKGVDVAILPGQLEMDLGGRNE